jgi:hypothetical protein
LKVTNKNPEIFHKEVIYSLKSLLKNSIIFFLVIFFGCTSKGSLLGNSPFQESKNYRIWWRETPRGGGYDTLSDSGGGTIEEQLPCG